jgi:predicted alpha/beta superfamily hydrolase
VNKLLISIFILITPFGVNGQDTILKQNVPFVLGKIDQIHSNILSENRTLNVYLPQGYDTDSTTNYPVIYLLDGSADEDFIHIAGIVQFLNFPWIKTLPKSILVGIANGDRKRDFTFPTTIAEDKKQSPTSGGSAKFIAFISEELQPFIGKNFRTNSSKTLIGQSLGGLLATEILFKKPQLFSKYIIISPSLWWNNESILKMKPASQQDGTKVYIAVGNEEKVMKDDARKLVSVLNLQGKKTKVYFKYFPQEDHATILHLAAYDAFKTFGKK